MKLMLSIAAENRHFGKAMRRVLPIFEPFKASFERQPMVSPIHEAILVGLTDSLPAGSIQEVPDRGGFFQVLYGLGPWANRPGNDKELQLAIIDALQKTIQACPFVPVDRVAFMNLVEDWARRELAV
jgi:hypothetical protein